MTRGSAIFDDEIINVGIVMAETGMLIGLLKKCVD